MPKVHANGITLHYLSTGRGADLVMLHGFLGNLAVWHLQIVPELRSHFRVTTYDLRGHGFSQVTTDGYTTRHMAGDLLALLDALGIGRAYLVGHSFGADVCLHFALHHADRVDRLVAIEPGLAALVHQRKHKDWEGWTYWVSKLAEVGLDVPPEKRSDLEYLLNLTLETPKLFGPARGLPRNRAPLLNLLRNTTLVRDYEDAGDLTLDAVRRIHVPTLLIYGERSHFLGSYHFLRHALPNCTPVLLQGGEHFGPLEQAGELTELILDFLHDAETPACEGAGVEAADVDVSGESR
jgi:pimeloyl-ACP methyl ester carboxylesterase